MKRTARRLPSRPALAATFAAALSRTLSRALSTTLSTALSAALLLLLSSSPLPAATSTFSLGGLLTAQTTARFDVSFEPLISLRFIPDARVLALPRPRRHARRRSLRQRLRLGRALPRRLPPRPTATSSPTAAWLRLSTSRFEARVGLQKINFGSATLFRPLMWFDSLDPRDPLQITDGVYAPPPPLLHQGQRQLLGLGDSTATTTPAAGTSPRPTRKRPNSAAASRSRSSRASSPRPTIAARPRSTVSSPVMDPCLASPRPARPRGPVRARRQVGPRRRRLARGHPRPPEDGAPPPALSARPHRRASTTPSAWATGSTSWPSTSGSSRAPRPSAAATS